MWKHEGRQRGCGVNREGRKLARRKMDVKGREDAPGYVSGRCVGRGPWRGVDSDEE